MRRLPPKSPSVAAVVFLATACWTSSASATPTSAPEVVPQPLFVDAIDVSRASRHTDSLRWRPVYIDSRALEAALEMEPRRALGDTPLVLRLFPELEVIAERERLIRNRSGSISWVGKIRGDRGGSVVLVSRDGVSVASVRTARSLFMLYYAGRDHRGAHLHEIHQIDESALVYQEESPTTAPLAPERLAAAERLAERKASGAAPQDDGSIQDLLVIYTPAARDIVGGVVAMENLIDLGVTETNLSYESSGVLHRIRLAHTALTDYDESQPAGCPRDLVRIKDDGHMDEVHALRDNVRADLVKLITAGGNCGRAHIMEEVSLAFEEFAFCYTRYLCVSPGYTFQHELGHIQSARHRWGGDNTDNAPFTFNHGYADPLGDFRTIMGHEQNDCPDCPRVLYWSNPDLEYLDTGVAMGIPEGQPFAADNRKALNATAWTVANFRVSSPDLLIDGFESGGLSAWSLAVP